MRQLWYRVYQNPFVWWKMLYWRFRWYVWPRKHYLMKCQYCGAVTGVTLHPWATEDRCDSEMCGQRFYADVESVQDKGH